MIKVENIETWGFEHAIRGMRNPLNSWNKSDSKNCLGKEFTDCTVPTDKCPRKDDNDFDYDIFCIGKADLDLMHRLYVAGQPHRKYLRQIFVSMDITAPLYWWKEFDTYKVGTVANSCSTMHKIAAKEFERNDFSNEHLPKGSDAWCDTWELATSKNMIPINKDEPLYLSACDLLDLTIRGLNHFREKYLETKDKKFWWQMIQLLPSSYNQKRTITINYENVVNIIEYRTGHKLDEWNEFVDILWGLPYLKEIAGEDE